MRIAILCVVCLAAIAISVPSANACGPQVRIDFTEDSPDWFRISFLHGKGLTVNRLTISLATSAAGAFFEGDNLKFAQGFAQRHPRAAGVSLTGLVYRQHMDAEAILSFTGLTPGRVYDFHSDLDDLERGANRNGDRIYDGELKGGTASALLVSDTGRRILISGTFDDKGSALLGPRACV